MKLVLAIVLSAVVAPVAPLVCGEPMTVTTDTTDYCEQLVRKIVERDSHASDIVHLLDEGRQMCDHGEVRGGIARLRRALVLLKHRTPG